MHNHLQQGMPKWHVLPKGSIIKHWMPNLYPQPFAIYHTIDDRVKYVLSELNTTRQNGCPKQHMLANQASKTMFLSPQDIMYRT